LQIFDDDITALKGYIESRRIQGRAVRRLDSGEGIRRYRDFMNPEGASIVLSEDTWLELGSPGTKSTAPALVTENLDLVDDGVITLIGPDIPEAQGTLPFAQILLIASKGLKDEDYRKINTFQYELELAGYMIKAVPSSLTIWSRVSKDSAARGLCFEILGRAIIESYKSQFDISSLEILFVCSSQEDVADLDHLHAKVTRIIAAMNKMIEETEFDCSSCEYLDVCGDVRQLGALRERLMAERQKQGGRPAES
jgi:CO dehydrogenase/acetyl-CoA synthase beta subunit